MKIFVSYSRRDAGDFAEQIQRHFTSFKEYDVFTDVSKIKVGDTWSSTIAENISNCDVFVVIATHGALQSPHVEKEVLQAKTEKKRIIPCFHRNVRDNDIKWGLNEIQGVEFEEKFELARNLYSKIANGQQEKGPMPNNQREERVTLPRTPKSRPTGVTIIAILSIIGGVLMLIYGIASVALAFVSLSGSILVSGGILIAIGVGGILIAIGVISFVVAYGLLKGRHWAWTVTVILSIISIVLNAISLATAANIGGIVSIIISGIILYYLFRPHVKSYFGKTISTSTTSSATQA